MEAGERVVLIVAAPPDPEGARAGRLAVLVGDPEDPAVRAAASEMEGELYSRPG